jgi:hypothetical protein
MDYLAAHTLSAYNLKELYSLRDCWYYLEANPHGIISKKTLHLYSIRCVAQPGSALLWGSRGRGFESRHTDNKKGSDLFQSLFSMCDALYVNRQIHRSHSLKDRPSENLIMPSIKSIEYSCANLYCR